MQATFRSVMLWMGLLVVLFLAWHFAQIKRLETPLRFSDFMAQVEAGHVTDVAIDGNQIKGHLTSREAFRTQVPDGYPGYVDTLLQNQVAVVVARDQTPAWANMLISWTPFLLLIGFFVFFTRQMKGKNVTDVEAMKNAVVITLDSQSGNADVAGAVAAALEDLRPLLSGPRKPAVLLTGPSGSGKSHLLRALASRLGGSVLLMDTAQFAELFVGVAAARVRNLMKRARDESALAVAIDGLDLLRRRPGDRANEADERIQALQQLSSSLDEWREKPAFAIIGITNRPDLVDEALLRRFDRVVSLGAPDGLQRRELLGQLVAGLTVAGADLDAIAADTEGWLPSDLRALVDDARHQSGDSLRSDSLKAALAAREAVRRTFIGRSAGEPG